MRDVVKTHGSSDGTCSPRRYRASCVSPSGVWHKRGRRQSRPPAQFATRRRVSRLLQFSLLVEPTKAVAVEIAFDQRFVAADATLGADLAFGVDDGLETACDELRILRTENLAGHVAIAHRQGVRHLARAVWPPQDERAFAPIGAIEPGDTRSEGAPSAIARAQNGQSKHAQRESANVYVPP